MELALPRNTLITRNIVPVKPADLEPLTTLMVAAFLDDPLMEQLERDVTRRAAMLNILLGTVLRYCVRYGRADMSSDRKAVACWLLPGQNRVSLVRLLRQGMWRVGTRLPLAALTKLLQYDRASRQLKEAVGAGACWHLWAMAVDPNHRGQGLGKQLHRAVSDRADREATRIYVETANPKTAARFTAAGYVAGASRPLIGELSLHSFVRAPLAASARSIQR
jgi:GNAT superfamily N-acetyltransferase